MKRSFFIPFLICTLPLLLWGCQKNAMTTSTVPTGDSSKLALDWAGTYLALIPCADCEGIVTTIDLNEDETYRMTTVYQGKSDQPFVREGTFSWNTEGTKITLSGMGNGPSQYLVGENILFQLDLEGNRITGNLAQNFMLRKQVADPKNPLVGKRWILREMMGREVPSEMNTIYLEFAVVENRVSGFGGCNSFFGEYEAKEGNRISFDKMGRTQKFCQGTSEMEDALFKAFETIDNYTLGDDGVLSLNRARMAPLLRFELDEGF